MLLQLKKSYDDSIITLTAHANIFLRASRTPKCIKHGKCGCLPIKVAKAFSEEGRARHVGMEEIEERIS